MTRIETLLKELDEQAVITRVFMERVRTEDFNWQPHAKSMLLIRLATHIAELPSWISMTLHTDELDFESSPYQPEKIGSGEELVAYFEKCYQDGRASLTAAKEEDLDLMWTLRSGSVIHSVSSKAEVIRMAYNQIVHHRAQLGVYFRLLDIPVPKSFGPSADDFSF